MTEEEMMQLYAILQMVPGKTASQRFNLLQDVGFDPSGRRQQFVEEQFIGDPEPELVNPFASAYGRDPAWQNIFGKIESGMDPDSAVAAAIKEKVIPKPGYGDKANNPYDIARQYALKEAENEAAYNQWASRNRNEAAVFGEKQNRLRSQFEAEQPYTMEDLRGVSQYESKGAPTVDELVQAVKMRRGSERTGRMAPIRGDVLENPKYERALRQRLEKGVAKSKETFVPTERSRGAMKNIALMQMLGG